MQDDISDLTFDRSEFDATIYTQSPLQRDLEQQQHSQDMQHEQQQHSRRHSSGEHDIELTERNVHRFGTRKGYAPAPALAEDSGSESDSSSSHRVSSSPQGRGRRARPPPLSRKELMTQDFTARVQEASQFSARFYNMSTLVLLAQIVVMALMVHQGGVVPLAENVMLGPSVFVMLDFGALQGGYVIYEHQWWRLVSAMFVHAGLVHLACNAYVQVILIFIELELLLS